MQDIVLELRARSVCLDGKDRELTSDHAVQSRIMAQPECVVQSLGQRIRAIPSTKVIKGIVFEVCLICAIIYVPFLQDLFQTASFDWKDWIFLVLIPFPVVLLEEIRKAIVRWSDKMKRVGGN